MVGKSTYMGGFTLLVLLALTCQASLVNGNVYLEDEQIMLNRLDLARLSQIRVETRKYDLDRKCNFFDGELRSMLGGSISSASQPELFSRVIQVLGNRKLPFGNNQPVLEDLEICYDAARSGSLHPHQSDSYRREVIASPPYHDPIRDSSARHMSGALSEFDDVKRRVRDHGQDLYANGYDNRAVDSMKREIGRDLDKIEDKLEDIVEDAADGRLDGLKSGRSYYPSGGSHNTSPHAISQDAKRAIRNGLEKIEDKLEDIVEDAADGRLDGHKSGYHAGYNAGHSLDSHYAAKDAKRAIKNGLEKIEDKLEDIVEDAADGRLDGMKRGAGFHDYSHGYPPVDTHRATQDAKRAIRNGLDQIEDKLEDIVEDAADGRLDGIKSNYHHYPSHAGYHDDHHSSHGYNSHPADIAHDAKRAINSGLNRIEDKLEDLVEDAADGRIDGHKGVHPNIHDPYAHTGYSHHADPYHTSHHSAGYPDHESHYAAHDAKRAIRNGLEKIEDKLEDIVEDAADGRLDGHKSGLHSSHYPSMHHLDSHYSSHQHTDPTHHLAHEAAHAMHSGLNRIEDKLEDLVEDMEDGRIDGIKGHGLEQRHRAEQLAHELARERVENRRLSSMLADKQYEVDSMRHKLHEVSKDMSLLVDNGRDDRARYESMRDQFNHLTRRENELARSLEHAKSELYEKDRLLNRHHHTLPHSVTHHKYAIDHDDDDDDDDDHNHHSGYHGLDPVGMLKKLEDKMSSHEDLDTRCQRYSLFFKEMPRSKDRVKQLAKMPIYGTQIILTPIQQSQMRRFAQVLSRSYKKSSMKISEELNLCIARLSGGGYSSHSPMVSHSHGYPSSSSHDSFFDSSPSLMSHHHLEEPSLTHEYHEIAPDGSRITRVSKTHAKHHSLKVLPPSRPGFSSFQKGMNRARMSMPSMPGIPSLNL